MKREKDRLRKAKEKKKRNRPHGGGAAKLKGVQSSAIMRSDKTLQKQNKDAMRKYNIHKTPGAHLSFDQRERLAADWNRLVRNGPKPHPAKTVPGRLQMKDRPKEANKRSRPGHLEMDTIVSYRKIARKGSCNIERRPVRYGKIPIFATSPHEDRIKRSRTLFDDTRMSQGMTPGCHRV